MDTNEAQTRVMALTGQQVTCFLREDNGWEHSLTGQCLGGGSEGFNLYTSWPTSVRYRNLISINPVVN